MLQKSKTKESKLEMEKFNSNSTVLEYHSCPFIKKIAIVPNNDEFRDKKK
jgi:hypothetical protein